MNWPVVSTLPVVILSWELDDTHVVVYRDEMEDFMGLDGNKLVEREQ